MLTKNNFSLTHFFFLFNQTLENTKNYLCTRFLIETNVALVNLYFYFPNILSLSCPAMKFNFHENPKVSRFILCHPYVRSEVRMECYRGDKCTYQVLKYASVYRCLARDFLLSTRYYHFLHCTL